MRAVGGGESDDSSPNLGCAGFNRGARLDVETEKNKPVAFLIKAALEERVGVSGSRGVTEVS